MVIMMVIPATSLWYLICAHCGGFQLWGQKDLLWINNTLEIFGFKIKNLNEKNIDFQ